MTATDHRVRSRSRRRPVDWSSLPPGPRLPYPVQTILTMRYRHRFVPAMHARYGDALTLRIAPGPRAVVLVRRPEDVRAVFAGDPADYHAGEGNAILGPVMGQHSVLLSDGDQHQRVRTLLMPAFNGASLRGYRHLVTNLTRREVASWPAAGTVSALDRMNALTLEIILQVVFGITDEPRLDALRPRVTRTVDIGPGILLGWLHPRLLRYGRWRRYAENLVALDALLYAQIASRREDPDLEGRDDVLSRLLRPIDGADGKDGEAALTDAELRDQLVTLLLAGHETTASALAWSLHELARAPDLLARASAAADEGPAGDAYLEAVFKESLRLHPVIPMVARMLTSPQRIAGYDLPTATVVAPSILLAHASPDSFAEPAGFDPDRFLLGQPAPHTWIPFGGGVRRCLGAGFALMEGVAVLREVLRAYAVSADGPESPRTRNITSVPAAGARIRVVRRVAAT